MPALSFVKMQAVGNDFVVLPASEADAFDPAALARSACHRRTGVGADGLLLIGEAPDADLSMRIFNADGTEDTMCGNGLRCVVRLAHEQGRIPPEGVAATRAGRIPYRIASQTVCVDLGPPRFDPAGVPHRGAEGDARSGIPIRAGDDTLVVHAVNTGSTHAVVFTPGLPDEDAFRFWSPRVENDPLFPERTSLIWTVIEAPDRLRLRIWERGVGETKGCGTGAAAAAALARASGKTTAPEIEVISPGGTLRVRWDDGAEALWLCGSAEITFRGVLPFSHLVLK